VSTDTERTNYLVLCSSTLGLNLLLSNVLGKQAAQEDIHFHDAASITMEKARQVEREARLAPRGSSRFTHFYIYNLHNIPIGSAQPLLKVAEEAAYARFIFHAQSLPRKVRTLMSRSVVVKLPFMSKAAVLANMKALSYDAKVADNLNLYDGTLQGTINALQMKDTLTGIRREIGRGQKGFPALMSQDTIGSLAFQAAVEPILSEEERSFLRMGDTPDRRRLVLFSATERLQ